MVQLDDDDKELSFLKENYNNLHYAYWECHRIYWQMTSIFLPLVLTGGVLTLKDTNNRVILSLIFLILFSLLAFWFLITKFLDSWNETRQKRLKAIEEYFNSKFPGSITETEDLEWGRIFMQYNLPYSKNYKKHFDGILKAFPRNPKGFPRDVFPKLNLYLYIFLSIGVLGIFAVKLLDP